LLQRTIAIAANETGGSLHHRLAELAPAALTDALSQLEKGIAPRLPQDHSLATYAPKFQRADGRIDWSQPAEVIERKIRAYDPWPGAFTVLGDRTLKIFRAQTAPAKENELTFKAGDGFVAATEVQLEGSRRMNGAEFLRGHSRLTASAAPQ
jgi:methionyl-tRNA formyltransferase